MRKPHLSERQKTCVIQAADEIYYQINYTYILFLFIYYKFTSMAKPIGGKITAIGVAKRKEHFD